MGQYLDLKDHFIIREKPLKTHLKIDMQPFYDYYPSIRDTKAIGHGVRFLNRYLCSRNFQDPDAWNAKLFEFIKLHKYNDRQLLVNGSQISDHNSFLEALANMIDRIREIDPDQDHSEIAGIMAGAGFEPGWGNTAGRTLETMEMLLDFTNEPTNTKLENFISRIPMPLISRIAIISPHGWFAQENVLGRPDTGGQVIYILDQVRALERHLQQEIALTGLNVKPQIIVLTRQIPDSAGTTCGIRKEQIFGTDNGWILRVPFRDRDGHPVEHWISRFHVWPFLETFAEDAAIELLSEFGKRPDLIIGNYSDGNLVATLLSDKLNVIQCTIAHALEKTKYLFSDLYWKDLEADYNFSLQFAADLLSMNKSDFIIASTHQEIIGTEDTMGQYESYQHFSLPGLFQITGGINLYAPKFNVIPPGVDEEIYFPFHQQEKRIRNQSAAWENRIFTDQNPDIFGDLADPAKRPIFTMARFDRIKNITGLIEAFGGSEKLRQQCNLIFAAGTTHLEDSKDAEERAEIEKAYRLIEEYDLHGSIRWLPSINKLDTGEVYRLIADRRGIFVQPALFEAFGLTILEAMLSGLPTFGPRFGGPLEIIEDGISGFLLNTSKPVMIAERLEDFMAEVENNADYWDKISAAGVKRVQEFFTWKLYSQNLVRLTKLYGFWRFAFTGNPKTKMDRYCDLIYNFLFKERAERLG